MEKLRFAASVCIMGTMGVFVHYVDAPSAVIACARATIGTTFLLLVILVTRMNIQWERIRKNALLLVTSGLS